MRETGRNMIESRGPTAVCQRTSKEKRNRRRKLANIFRQKPEEKGKEGSCREFLRKSRMGRKRGKRKGLSLSFCPNRKGKGKVKTTQLKKKLWVGGKKIPKGIWSKGGDSDVAHRTGLCRTSTKGKKKRPSDRTALRGSARIELPSR